MFEPNIKSKKDLDIINKILKRQPITINDNYGPITINCSLWVFASDESLGPQATKRNNRDPFLMRDYCPLTQDQFDIVLDLSRANNLAKGVQLNHDLYHVDSLLT